MKPGTKAVDLYVQKHEAALHTVTYWHARITVYVPVGEPEEGGGSYVYNFECVHNHQSRAAAQSCEDHMARIGKRGVQAVASLPHVKKMF